MTGGALTRARLAAYSALALPLAMAALPIYVHVPRYYADDLGLSLAAVGAILLGARLLDAIQDPLLGWLSDRSASASGGRNRYVLAAVPLLALGVLAVFNPPAASGSTLGLWLAGSLVVVYLGFSMATISYFAIGAALSTDYHQRTRVTATRSALGVIGVLIAAALPDLLAGKHGAGEGLRLFSLLYVPILLVGAGLMLFGSPPSPVAQAGSTDRPDLRTSLLRPLRNAGFRWLLGVFAISGVASAIPVTLILFYVQDVLQQPQLNAVFLGLYFVFGALGMPLWVAASRRVGKKNAWLFGMGMSVVAFIGAYLLGAGDALEFGIVCAVSGIAYGAELALPPSILADIIDRDEPAQEQRPDGAYFGLWQLTEKLNLALAAGIALPVLGLLGYRPGTEQVPMGRLSLIYAAVPCLLKIVAVIVLWLAPVERRDWTSSVAPGASRP